MNYINYMRQPGVDKENYFLLLFICTIIASDHVIRCRYLARLSLGARRGHFFNDFATLIYEGIYRLSYLTGSDLL